MTKVFQDTKKCFAAALQHMVQQKWGLQTELAKKLKVTQQTISKLAHGKMEGREADRRKLASLLGYDYETFLQLGYELLHPERKPVDTNIAADIELPAKLKHQISYLLVAANEDEKRLLQFTIDSLFEQVKQRNKSQQ